MKLLVVLSVREYRQRVAGLLEEAGINRFSTTDITGYKKSSGSISWFASHPDNAKMNSILIFSFTTEDIANRAIGVINKCNKETENPFPVHAFVVNVESFSNLL